MSQQCSWPTLSWPLEGRCLYYALLGLTQAPGFAGGHDSIIVFYEGFAFPTDRKTGKTWMFYENGNTGWAYTESRRPVL